MTVYNIEIPIDNKIDNQIDNSIEQDFREPGNTITVFQFWSFSDPLGKTLTDFSVNFEGGQVTAEWGDGSSQILTSSVNYNKTFS